MNLLKKFSTGFLLFIALSACEQSYKGPTYFIEPPFKNIPAAYDQFELDPAKAKIIRLTNGSSIEVPENAFVDKNGNPITSKVVLQYRQFNTAADILTSGIPMKYTDETGEQKQLESGGMFELTAKADGSELAIASGKKIKVNLASTVEGDFDFYYLQEENAKNISTASLISEAHAQQVADQKYYWKKIYSKEEELKTTKENKKTRNPNAHHFQLHFDTLKYPETKALDTVKWEYAGRNKNEDPSDGVNAWTKKESWKYMTVSKPSNYAEQLIKSHVKSDYFYYNFFILNDTSGFLINDETGTIALYSWNGSKKTVYKNATRFAHLNYNEKSSYINNKGTHLILYDSTSGAKLFTIKGHLIKDLGETYHCCFAGDDRVLYYSHDTNNKAFFTIISLSGETIKKFALDEYYYANTGISKDGNNIFIKKGEDFLVLDLDGNIIKRHKYEGYTHASFAGHNNSIVFYSTDKSVTVWDWKNDKTYQVRYTLDNKTHIEANDNAPLLLIQNEKEIHLWNWEKDTYVDINKEKEHYFHFSATGNYIISGHEGYMGQEVKLISKEGQQLIQHVSAISLSDKEDRALVYIDSTALLLTNINGKKIFDFKKYDPAIHFAWFRKNGQILTSSSDGKISLWDQQGKITSTVNTNYLKPYALDLEKEDLFSIYSREEDITAVWSFNSHKHLYSFGNSNPIWYSHFVVNDYPKNINNYPTILCYARKGMYLWKYTDIPLEEDVYQVSFLTEDNDFTTYVRLTDNQLELLRNHKKALKRRKKEEEKRVEEESKLIRSFEINKFGIYNWDKYYNDTNAVVVNLQVDLDTIGIDFNNITFFLITGKDRTAVIKYPKAMLEKFRFVTSENNFLVAVLPGERLAVFDEESFRNLDIEKIKKEGRYRFKMKISDGKASKKILDDLFKKPS